MFELIFITSILSLGFAIDVIASNDDDAEEPLIEQTLAEGELRFDGTDAGDHVTGNAMDNIFIGDGGDDVFGSLAGDDTLIGGAGNDRLFGGTGNDTAIGGDGDDRIFLGDGDDTTEPSLENGQDAGDDFIRGGAGADTLYDTRGSNQIFGDVNADLILTVDGLTEDGANQSIAERGTTDTLNGGFGNDTLVGDDGDLMTGGDGADRFVVARPSFAPGAPAVVTDFDLGDDLFSVVYLQDTPGDDTVVFTFDPNANLLRAHVEGAEVATLEGLTEADIPFINTFVTTLPELMTTGS